MNILVAGFGGMIGTRLSALFGEDGHQLIRLVRPGSKSRAGEQTREWNPAEGLLDPAHLAGIDAVIHLGGVNIAEKRWSTAFKRAMRDSRILTTGLLAETMAAMEQPPACFLCASAVGFYGDRRDSILTETEPAGEDFLARLVADWESATSPAQAAGVRVVNLRIGIVLDAEGGALTKMLTPFRLGLGGYLGDGSQYMSWISLDDVTRAIHFCLQQDQAEGPVNLAAPEAVTNKVFSKALAKNLHRPALLPVPAFMIRTLMGEMGQSLVLCSTRAVPKKLEALGFQFNHTRVDAALAAALKG